MTELPSASIAPMVMALRAAALTIAEAALERARRTPTERNATLPELRTLEDLVAHWERIARRAFFDAKVETSDFGRRFIENKAMNYYNCAQDLRRALGVPLRELSATRTTRPTPPRGAA